MEHREYNSRKMMIYQEAVEQIRKLDRKFAESGCEAKVGSIINDHQGSIEVTKIIALHNGGNQYPCIKFQGYILKKDLMPRKDKRKRWVYGYLGSV